MQHQMEYFVLRFNNQFVSQISLGIGGYPQNVQRSVRLSFRLFCERPFKSLRSSLQRSHRRLCKRSLKHSERWLSFSLGHLGVKWVKREGRTASCKGTD